MLTANRLALTSFLASLTMVSIATPQAIDFGREIRPLLSDNCFRCHGPDEAQRQAGLRLDSQAAATAPGPEGRTAIVPGQLSESELWRRVTSPDPDVRMPPTSTGKRLTDEELSRLRGWIEAGAVYEPHWSLVPPRRAPWPPTQLRHWVRNPVDRFVLAGMERAGLAPSQMADRATLVRRVTQDLTGLPPTLTEIRQYQQDPAPDAYERLVDRLLHSPRFGEHVARHWLDVARYGDTHGLHLDNERSIWPYRDWVIDAFNRNQPFDQFTVEQLAGDLLPGATLEQRVATGFHRCNATTSENGAIDAEYLARYASERAETTATVWLGLTAGCAACHDHKYDPLTQREFYQLYAFFYRLTERAMDGNALLPPPAVRVPTVPQLARQRQLEQHAALADARASEQRERSRQHVSRWLSEYQAAQPALRLDDWLIACPLDETDGEAVVVGRGPRGRVVGTPTWDAGRLAGGLRLQGQAHVDIGDQADIERDEAFSVSAWVYVEDDGQRWVLSRMSEDAASRGYAVGLADRRIVVQLNHHAAENALSVRTRLPIVKQKWQHLTVTYDGSSRAAGVGIFLNGVEQELELLQDGLTDSIRSTASLRLGQGPLGQGELPAAWTGMLDEVRLYPRLLTADEVQSLAVADPLAGLLAVPVATRTAAQQEQVEEQLLTRNDADYRRMLTEQRAAHDRLRRLEGLFASSLVMEEMSQARQAYCLLRGQYDQLGEPVEPNVPAALPPLATTGPANRLDLARWLVSPQQPLTARVTVNRLWQQLWGVGLVATPEDFGSQGDWPSHPELLDWLALELQSSGWDMKHLARLIVTSSVYRQDSAVSPAARVQDPHNRWLSRGPRYRLDAEQIRDQALAVSGLLVERTGGKSVRPYQPAGLWEAVGYTTSNTAKYVQDHGAALYRRSLYTFWKRTSPPPTMQVLDAPSREVCTVRRPRTNTPTAALALMNDPQFVEAAREFAGRIVREGGRTDAQRIRFAWQVATARDPVPSEVEVLLDLLQDARRDYRQDTAGARQLITQGESPPPPQIDAAELASWTLVATTMLNLDETMSQR